MTRKERFTRIASEHLGIETLETRNRDGLDFHTVSVTSITKALDAACLVGQGSLLKAAEALLEARENQMITAVEWDALRRAVKAARKTE